MDIKTLKKIEMKNDGKDYERFESLVKQVVSVPKKELDRREAKYQAEKAKKRLVKS